MTIASIIKDSEYSLSLFPEEYIKELENGIIEKKWQSLYPLPDTK